jgi:MoaA/NifB/PqqE/SkfB family radical SAM enzyme
LIVSPFFYGLNISMNVQKLHVEPSSHCNARCPGCPRNLNGYNIDDLFKKTHLTAERFSEILYQYPNVRFLLFNGNLGDPMMNPHMLSLVDVAKHVHELRITTNGSIGKLDTFERLGAMKNVIMTFSIDGLEDTNHLYRQDVEWNKIMERAKKFIGAGGRAEWKFIIFRHNQHQVEEARSLSKELGFTSFEVVDHSRNNFPALNKDGTVSHWVLPAETDTVVDQKRDHSKANRPHKFDLAQGLDQIKKVRKTFHVNKSYKTFDCEHLREKSVYVSAEGELFPCCYQGIGVPTLGKKPLGEFDRLKETWNTGSPDHMCGAVCGRNT